MKLIILITCLFLMSCDDELSSQDCVTIYNPDGTFTIFYFDKDTAPEPIKKNKVWNEAFQ